MNRPPLSQLKDWQLDLRYLGTWYSCPACKAAAGLVCGCRERRVRTLAAIAAEKGRRAYVGPEPPKPKRVRKPPTDEQRAHRNELRRRRYWAHREKRKAQLREYYAANKERLNANLRAARAAKAAAEREEAS